MDARIGSYSGAWWDGYNRAVGATMKDGPLYWAKDPQAQHCSDCLEYGDTGYESFKAMLAITGGRWPSHGVICRGNCRCILQGGTGQPVTDNTEKQGT